MGSGPGGEADRRRHAAAQLDFSRKASATTTTGRRWPKTNSRPRKRPRSRRPRGDGRPLTDAKARQLFAREQKLLDEMTEIAEAARGLPDARVRKLIDWIRENMCPDLPLGEAARRPQWNDIRVIIFTEYDDTKRYLHQQLSAAIADTDRAGERIAIYHGPTPPDEREEIKRAFNADPTKHPVRILIATDAAREGLNLQAHCWNLFHFDVPWNPSRMEQRNGRIDRKLQPKDEVYLPLLRLQPAPGRPHPRRAWSGRRKRSRRNWAAWPR